MIKPFSLLALTLALGTTMAQADTYVSYTLTAVLDPYVNGILGPPNGTVDGTIQIDTTTETFATGNFVVKIGPANFVFADNASGGQGELDDGDGGTLYLAQYLDAAGDQFDLEIPYPTLAGYSGSSLCDVTDTFCGDYASAFETVDGTITEFVDTGSLTPLTASNTPEPGGLVLMGTGALGLIVAARRRFSTGLAT